MKETLFLIIIAILMLAVILIGEKTESDIRAKQHKQYTLDSLHYERQEAKQDSIINKLDLIYGDVRRAE